MLNIVVGDKYPDSAVREVGYQLLYLRYGDWVDTGKRFIQQEKFWIDCKAAGDLGSPPFTPGEGVGLLMANRLNIELIQQLFQPGSFLIVGQISAGLQYCPDVVFH